MGQSDHDQELKLAAQIESHARSRQVRGWVIKLVTGLVLIGLIIAGAYELFTFGTARILATEALVLAVVLAIGFALGYSALLFWLGWSVAQVGLKKGLTRPALGTAFGMLGCSVLAALPFASLAINEDHNLYRAVLLLAFLSWINASALLLGYFSKFYSETKRLF